MTPRICTLETDSGQLTSGLTAVAQKPADRLAGAAFEADAVTAVQTDAATGVPTFLVGRLSEASSDAPAAVSARFLADNAAVFRLHSGDDMVARDVSRDALGLTHVRVQQTVRGVPVFGGDAVVHLDRTGACTRSRATSAPRRPTSRPRRP